MQNKKLRVLIVDDSELVIKKIKELLEGCECIDQIITAPSYQRAVELIDLEKPDVVLLDINLPFKSGIDVLNYIKTKSYLTRIIMVTNQAGDYYKDLCFKLGADYFIDKSKHFDTLPVIISSVN